MDSPQGKGNGTSWASSLKNIFWRWAHGSRKVASKGPTVLHIRFCSLCSNSRYQLEAPAQTWLSNKLKTGCPVSLCGLWLFLCWLWWFCDHLRDVPWEYIFKLSVSTAASEFCEWAQVGIDLYIPHYKYQIKPHSSPRFSAASVTAIAYRNHFFCFYQRNKSSESKVNFRQTSTGCKKVLETAKLAYITKTRVHHFPETWLPGHLANCY